MKQAGRIYQTTSLQDATCDSEQYDTPNHCHKQNTKITPPTCQTLPEVTFVYSVGIECSGTIPPQRLSVIQDAYNYVCHRGTLALLNPPSKTLQQKIQGLLHRLP